MNSGYNDFQCPLTLASPNISNLENNATQLGTGLINPEA
ncbi:hypothetical protein ANO14919_127770 [Xylariales sp. No.14919]|nr:hypothetical protein ANO14919_127770 [Xylariales sp. No.14919]